MYIPLYILYEVETGYCPTHRYIYVCVCVCNQITQKMVYTINDQTFRRFGRLDMKK